MVVSNHQSFLDLVLLGCAIPRRLSYVARTDLADSSIYRFMTAPFDVIPLRRGESDRRALKRIVEALKGGSAVLLFPEGTRTRTGRLGALRAGFLLMAGKAEVPIVPVRLEGSFQVWPRGRTIPGRGSIRLTVNPTLRVENRTREAVLKEVRSGLEPRSRALDRAGSPRII